MVILSAQHRNLHPQDDDLPLLETVIDAARELRHLDGLGVETRIAYEMIGKLADSSNPVSEHHHHNLPHGKQSIRCDAFTTPSRLLSDNDLGMPPSQRSRTSASHFFLCLKPCFIFLYCMRL
jgi:hypothetical protein